MDARLLPMVSKPPLKDLQAAGAVVFRKAPAQRNGATSSSSHDVLLVHRPRYNDWAFPKGKLDRGEHLIACAIREVAEETGLDIRLGPKLSSQRYALKALGRMKTVHYWVGRVVGEDSVEGYSIGDEIDSVRWVPVDKAMKTLTYDYDRETLAEAMPFRKKSRALVVLRHAEARSRKAWRKDDRIRPLLKTGALQAEKLVPLLAAYDVKLVATSTSTRCLQTVLPYADLVDLELTPFIGLSEEGATPERVASIIDQVRSVKSCAVVCTHRPVLPKVFEALDVERFRLEPADFVVFHHRRGKILSTEHHSVAAVNMPVAKFM